MRKLLAATAIALSLTAPAQAQFFWGSGPGWGQGGGWNACSNCGMRGYGPGGGYYSEWAGATNGFGAGMRGWGGIPSANGYGMGWGGNALVGQTLGQFMGGGYGGGMGMMGGMGPLGMLGGLFGGGMPGNYYPGAMYQQPGAPPPNGYAYNMSRYGGGGAYPQPQYRNPAVYQKTGPGPGYPYAQSNGPDLAPAQVGNVANPVYIQSQNMEPRGVIPGKECRLVKVYSRDQGFVYRQVCVPG